MGVIFSALADAEGSQDLGTSQASERVQTNLEISLDEDGNSCVDDDIDLKTVQFDKEVKQKICALLVLRVHIFEVFSHMYFAFSGRRNIWSGCSGRG